MFTYGVHFGVHFRGDKYAAQWEAATAGGDGVTRAVIGNAWRCGAGAVRRDGGRWRRGGSAPQKRGLLKHRPAFGVKELNLEDVNERWQRHQR